MTLHNTLRTIDLAKAADLSVQQVRNYEALHLLPQVARSKSGYRLYTEQHLATLKTTRSLVTGYGWQQTPRIMQALHDDNLTVALTLIDARHAELANRRQDCEQTLSALHALAEQDTSAKSFHRPQSLRIGEAAALVGMRVSALHFWEQQGLLQPTREKGSRYRQYDEQQIRRLRVIVLLREAEYSFEVMRTVLDELANDQPEKAIKAVE